MNKINISENLFMIYALGFTLEKIAAMQEHGIKGSGSPVPLCQTASRLILDVSLLQGNMGMKFQFPLQSNLMSFFCKNGFDLAFGQF